MINLRYLRIDYNVKSRSKLHFPEGLEWLSDKLRYLHWEVFPLKSLPSTFCPERLVVLSMTRSKLRKLWDGIQVHIHTVAPQLSLLVCRGDLYKLIHTAAPNICLILFS